MLFVLVIQATPKRAIWFLAWFLALAVMAIVLVCQPLVAKLILTKAIMATSLLTQCALALPPQIKSSMRQPLVLAPLSFMSGQKQVAMVFMAPQWPRLNLMTPQMKNAQLFKLATHLLKNFCLRLVLSLWPQTLLLQSKTWVRLASRHRLLRWPQKAILALNLILIIFPVEKPK